MISFYSNDMNGKHDSFFFLQDFEMTMIFMSWFYLKIDISARFNGNNSEIVSYYLEEHIN